VRDSADNFLGNPCYADAAFFVGVGFSAAAQFNFEGIFGALKGPRVAEAQPMVGGFHLPAVANLLVEDSIFVSNAVTNGGNVKSGERIHEAGGETAEAAIAETGFFFLFDQDVEIDSELAHGLLCFVEDAEIDEVVGEVRPGEELGREIADDADILSLVVADSRDPALDKAVADRVRESHVKVVDSGAFAGTTLNEEQVIEERLCERFRAQGGSLAF